MQFKYTIDPAAEEPIMTIYEHIGSDEEDGVIGVLGNEFAKELLFLDTLGKKRIQIYINSPGGVVMDGMAIYNAILTSKTKVDTCNVGIAASIAAVIFEAGRKRVMADYSLLMIHNPTGSEDKQLEAIKKSIVTMIAQRCNASEEKVAKLMEEETWFTAAEAISLGLADEMYESSDFNKPRLSKTDQAKASWMKSKVYNSASKNAKPPTTIQTLILNKSVFKTKEDANKWIVDHDFKIKEGAPDETEDSWRYRQRNPDEFESGSFRTIDITKGVKAVIGHLKKQSKTNKMNKVTNALNLNNDASEDSIASAIHRIKNEADEDKKKNESDIKKMEEKLKKAEEDYKKMEEDYKKMKSEYDEDKKKAEEDKKKNEEDKKAEDKKKAEEMVENFVKIGKIKNDKEVKAMWIEKAAADFDNVKTMLDSLTINKVGIKIEQGNGSSEALLTNVAATSMAEIRNKLKIA